VETPREVIVVEALKRVTRVDCNTHAAANAHGIGRLLQQELAGKPIWYFESCCPDCRSFGGMWPPAVDELVTLVTRTPPDEREARVAGWLASHGRDLGSVSD
jgi:hypothetical protein